MGFLNKLFSKKLDLQSQDASSIYTFYIEDIFTIKTVGCIVVGIVKGADIRVGDEVYIIDTNGNRLQSKVMGMENPRVGKMNIAPVGSNVGILLSDIEAKDLNRGDILTNEKKIN
ncbi:hypothetical protein [Clostridium lundense]|uniref:hypothetical protein n=1 Tax=Clostridium lundense TaxID=319475 RepID=UPI00047F46B9|nr:hypothetical protein [Clostridium lundense]